MNTIFSEVKLQEEFEKNGFVTLPVFTESEIDDLKSFYSDHCKSDKTGFHATMFDEDLGFRSLVDEKIRSVVDNHLSSILPEYKSLYANFMVKEPGENSDMYVHQDWTYVDETQYQSLAIWFPLQDLDHENGGLYVVPGTHLIKNIIRGPGIHDPYTNLHESIKTEFGHLVKLKAGEAILWDHRVVHYSPPNLSSDLRICPTAILVPEQADVFHYFKAPGSGDEEIEKFRVGREFYMRYSIGKRPQNSESLGFVGFRFDDLTLSQLKEVVPEPKNLGVGKRFLRLLGLSS